MATVCDFSQMNLDIGTALETEFEIEVAGCEDTEADFPLSYTYTMMQEDGTGVQPLTDTPIRGVSSFFTTVLSPGRHPYWNPNNNNDNSNCRYLLPHLQDEECVD